MPARSMFAALLFITSGAAGVAACSGTSTKACDPTTCATGCCTLEGKCENGATVAACGKNAGTCSVCAGVQRCIDGACLIQGVGGGSGAGGGSAGGSATSGGGSAGGGASGGGSGGGGANPLEGNFVVVRVGPAPGGGALSNASAQVALEVRSIATGDLQRTIPLPSLAGTPTPFTLSGSATSEGVLNRTENGHFALAGYAAEPGVLSVSSSTTVGRVVARVSLDGGVDTSTRITDAYPGNNIRAAASIDGTGYWLAGAANTSAGVRYVAHGSTGATTNVFSEQENIRSVHLFGGQLFASTQLGAAPSETVSRVFAIGLGAPMSPTVATTALPGVSISNPNTFVLLDLDLGIEGFDTLYVSDTNNAVGVRKYLSNGATWVERPSLQVPLDTACLNVIARPTTPPLVLCAASNGVVYRWRDTGPLPDGGLPERAIVVAAPANTVFRGLAFER